MTSSSHPELIGEANFKFSSCFGLCQTSLLFTAAKEVSKRIQVHATNRTHLTTVERLEEVIHGKRLGHGLLWMQSR